MVAPCVGAWIETKYGNKILPLHASVAPCVGAWIETTKVCIFRVRLGSRTLCAWIETSMITMQGTTQNVAPCVVRGLKLRQQTTPSSSRRCPCVGAWIETKPRRSYSGKAKVAPRVGAWIETNCTKSSEEAPSGRTPCGCVD